MNRGLSHAEKIPSLPSVEGVKTPRTHLSNKFLF